MNGSKIKQLIEEFRQLMISTADDRKDLQKIMNFLSVLQTFRAAIPPTAEFITIIKKRKPILFQYLRKGISSTSHLYFIIQLDMDYMTALQRLELADDPFFTPQPEAAE